MDHLRDKKGAIKNSPYAQTFNLPSRKQVKFSPVRQQQSSSSSNRAKQFQSIQVKPLRQSQSLAKIKEDKKGKEMQNSKNSNSLMQKSTITMRKSTNTIRDSTNTMRSVQTESTLQRGAVDATNMQTKSYSPMKKRTQPVDSLESSFMRLTQSQLNKRQSRAPWENSLDFGSNRKSVMKQSLMQQSLMQSSQQKFNEQPKFQSVYQKGGLQPASSKVKSKIIPKKKTITSSLKLEAFVDPEEKMRLALNLSFAGETPPPMDLVCIIDISGSMNGSAACQTDGKTEYEDLGYSLLDLVKHAVKTVLKAMRSEDQVAIILFNDKIHESFKFTSLKSDDQRQKIIDHIEQIKAAGSTNIFDALQKGIDIINARPALNMQQPHRNAAIMFFTDGQPRCGNYTNADSIVQQIKKQNINFNFPIHTYAFGQYQACSSNLLYQISKAFCGMFGYIQDAKTVGTIFINGIAYILCTAVNAVWLQVKLDGKIISPCNQWETYRTYIRVPGVRYGQSSEILFDLKGQINLKSKLEVKVRAFTQERSENQGLVTKNIKMQKCQSMENLDHQLRFDTIKLFQKIVAQYRNGTIDQLQKETKQFVEYLQNLQTESEFVPSLIDTVDRQTVTMLNKEKYVEKWGSHQLLHLIRSLEMQCRGNFRDQCLKDFGGEMFNDIADRADDIYNSMDPPKPSIPPKAKVVAPPAIQNAQQFAAQMNNFDDNDSDRYYGGGCFAGSNIIKMLDGSVKFVKDLVKGDKIATPNGEGATVKCLVSTETFDGVVEMCTLEDGLMVTPGHPVKIGNQWVYPRDIAQRQVVNCPAFYNLVVDKNFIAIVNNVELILLGHNYTFGILKHEYFGSKRVILDLEKLPGYEDGHIHLKQDQFRRVVKADNCGHKTMVNVWEAQGIQENQ